MSAQDFGVIITQPGVGVTGASKSQVSLNTSNPFIKIDTQNKNGNITLNMLITTDPPEPTGAASDAYTVLYQFSHGYTYVPSIETLFYTKTAPPAPGGLNAQKYFMDYGIIAKQTPGDASYLYAIADKTNVYIICDKYDPGGGFPNLLTGTTMEITIHVFVEDVGA